jgi:uncharacterized protein
VPTALITGASSGIGEVFARQLAERGYDLILVARREDRLRALAASLPAKAEILLADLSSGDGIAAVELTIRDRATLDLLINNAGFGVGGLFWEADLAAQIRMAWINSFTEGIDMELKAVGSPVTIQALCPGFTVTEFQKTAGVDATQVPALLWMPAEFVVAESLRGLDRGKLYVIPNWKYKLGAFLLKNAPYGLKRRFGRPWRKKD